MASEEDTIRDCIRAFNDQDPKNIYLEEKEALPFLFEYACQTLEYEGHKPQDYILQLPTIMLIHLERIIEWTMMNLEDMNKRKKIVFPDRSTIPFLVDQDHAFPFDPEVEYDFSKKNIIKNIKRESTTNGNPEIETAYSRLEETGVRFDRGQLEKWCFEAASLTLEQYGKQKIQSNYDKQILGHLNRMVKEANRLPKAQRQRLYISPQADYKNVAFCKSKPNCSSQ